MLFKMGDHGVATTSQQPSIKELPMEPSTSWACLVFFDSGGHIPCIFLRVLMLLQLLLIFTSILFVDTQINHPLSLQNFLPQR
jgi:hypothetical protein